MGLGVKTVLAAPARHDLVAFGGASSTRDNSTYHTLQLLTQEQDKRNSCHEFPLMMSSSQIVHATSDDVLLGRGSALMFHMGNVKYRQFVEDHKEEYKLADQHSKQGVAKKVVAMVRESGGRFLRRVVDCDGPEETLWTAIDESTALEKVKQSLREKRKLPRTEKIKHGKQKGSRYVSVRSEPEGLVRSKASKKAHVPISPSPELVGIDRWSILAAGVPSDEIMALSGIMALGHRPASPFTNNPYVFPSLAMQLRAGRMANQGLASNAEFYPVHSTPILHGTLASDPVKMRQEELFQKVLHNYS